MPSGSHGYGGSHSSSSGSSRSSSSGGGRSTHRRPISFHIGPSLFYFGTGVQNVFSILFTLCIFAVVFAFSSGSSLKAIKSKISYIENDRAGYVAMIERAEQNEKLVVDGEVISVWQDTNGSGKWAFDYKFTDPTGQVVVDNGFSFKVYNSRSEAPHEGEIIKLAVDSENITILSDSVPMDYKNFELKDDGDYINAVKRLNSVRIIYICCYVAIGICVIVFVILFFKGKQKKNADFVEANAQATPSGSTTPESDSLTTCDYCGASIKKGSSSCPNCGARYNL